MERENYNSRRTVFNFIGSDHKQAALRPSFEKEKTRKKISNEKHYKKNKNHTVPEPLTSNRGKKSKKTYNETKTNSNINRPCKCCNAPNWNPTQICPTRSNMQQLWKEVPLRKGMQTARNLETQVTECSRKRERSNLIKKQTNQNRAYIEMKESQNSS